MFTANLIELAHLRGFVEPLEEARKQCFCQSFHIAKTSTASIRGAAVPITAHE